jgi:hypothetical protein
MKNKRGDNASFAFLRALRGLRELRGLAFVVVG